MPAESIQTTLLSIRSLLVSMPARPLDMFTTFTSILSAQPAFATTAPPQSSPHITSGNHIR